MRIRAGKTAEVCAITFSNAGHEERDRRRRRSGSTTWLLSARRLPCRRLTRWRLTCWRCRWLLCEDQSGHGNKRQYRASKNTLCAIHIYSPWRRFYSAFALTRYAGSRLALAAGGWQPHQTGWRRTREAKSEKREARSW